MERLKSCSPSAPLTTDVFRLQESAIESESAKTGDGDVTKSIPELPKRSTSAKLVDCLYKAAGCKVKLPKGSKEETEHYRKCQFRPIPCLMKHVCSQLVPYSNFLLHHMKHYLIPTFSAYLNTAVFIEKEDFFCSNSWTPRWLNCYNKDFFVLISHKLQKWYFYVSMLGAGEEAEGFAFDIELTKGNTKRTATGLVVSSLRTTLDELDSINALILGNNEVRQLSHIQKNAISSFGMEIVIYKRTTSALPSQVCFM